MSQLQRFDITGVSETYWNESCDWSALMDDSRLCRRDGQGRRGRGVALYVTERIECIELPTGNGTVETLWVRIKEQKNDVDVTVRAYYRPYVLV